MINIWVIAISETQFIILYSHDIDMVLMQTFKCYVVTLPFTMLSLYVTLISCDIKKLVMF